MIYQIRNILFTTDLTENSRHAFNYAASLATRYGAGIVILHVREQVPTSTKRQLASFFGEEKWQQMQKEQEQEVRQILVGKQRDHDVIHEALATLCVSANADDTHCSFVSHKVIIKEEGKVVDEILAVAAEEDCDLIVMGAHKGLLGATAIGSIAKGVLHRSEIPALVVPPPKPA